MPSMAPEEDLRDNVSTVTGMTGLTGISMGSKNLDIFKTDYGAFKNVEDEDKTGLAGKMVGDRSLCVSKLVPVKGGKNLVKTAKNMNEAFKKE